MILPVHLYGQVADIDAIRLAAPGLPILEDAAHAHGATLGDRRAGSLGDIAAFSFYPTKLLGALGDGGAVTTSDENLEARIRQLRYMGQRARKHDHETIGFQERLDELQAAFLQVKLRYLEDQIAGRRRVTDTYSRLLAATPLPLSARDATGRHVYYMYTVLAPARDALAAHLAECGIETQIIYPRLVHQQQAYAASSWRAEPLRSPRACRTGSSACLCMPSSLTATSSRLQQPSAASTTDDDFPACASLAAAPSRPCSSSTPSPTGPGAAAPSGRPGNWS